MNGLRFSRKQLGIPYALFLICFVVAPLFVIIYYAFTNGEGRFTFDNLTGFFTSPNTIGTLAYSFLLAIVTTLVCLLLAYPIAYILARSEMKRKSVIVMMFVLPMWINFTLRITALKEVLTEKLLGLNRDDNTTILMVTHDSNAASFCKRILFIQDGRIFHELRRDMERESQQEFYERILKLMAQMGGGSANVL